MTPYPVVGLAKRLYVPIWAHLAKPLCIRLALVRAYRFAEVLGLLSSA